jgi:hypothetical protein
MLTALAMLAVSPEIRVPDLDGRVVQVLPSKARYGVVVFFVITACPIANAYVPEMNRIADTYGPKGFDVRLAYVDSLYSEQSLRKHHKEFGYSFPAVKDASRALTRLAGATKTPEAAVFSPGGELLYDGRIDNLYYALGRKRPKATVQDLRRSLQAILAGKPVPQKHTEVVGCFMPVD